MATTTTPSLKGTQTEKNLCQAYLAESTAYTRYMFYAHQANKEKLYPIEQIFTATANNEMHHGKIFFKYLVGGKCEVPMNIDAGTIGTTAENLALAAAEELSEGVEEYTAAAKTAQAEGFPDIAAHFAAIASIEQKHRDRFLLWLDRLNQGTIWKRDQPITWQCLVCGYEYTGTEPPLKCPACNHPQQYYMPIDEEPAAIVD